MRCLSFGKRKREQEMDGTRENQALIDDSTSYSLVCAGTEDVGVNTHQAAAGETEEDFRVQSETQDIETIVVPLKSTDPTSAVRKNDPCIEVDSWMTNKGASPPNISNSILPPDLPPSGLMATLNRPATVNSLPPREAGRPSFTIQHGEITSLPVKANSPRQVPHSEREDRLDGRIGLHRIGSGAANSTLDQTTTRDSALKVNTDPEVGGMMETPSAQISESPTYTERSRRLEHGTQTRPLRKIPKIAGRPESSFCCSGRCECCYCDRDGLKTVPCSGNCMANLQMHCKPCAACSMMMPLDMMMNGFYQPYSHSPCACNNYSFQRPCRYKLPPIFPYKRYIHCPFGCTTHSGWNTHLQPFANWNAKPSYVTMEISPTNH